MRGMKSLVAPTKRQNYADGGVVGAIKGMFGIKPEDPERARMLAEYKANAEREKQAAKAAAAAPAPAPAPAITDYAAGGALKRREAAAGLKDGGPVRGPGTGTSDDVPDNVPEGTYIMPADSTQAIGEKTLGGLGMRGFKAGGKKAAGGKSVPVNLSNGEFKLPPKQVHAIGVQTLNQLKDATHTPSSTEAAKGMKPELFFEGGGVVDEEKKRLQNQTQAYVTGAQAAAAAAPATPAAPVPAAPAPAAKDPLDGGAAFGVFPQLAGGKRTTYAMDEKLRTGVEATGPSTFVQATPLDKTIIGGGNGQRMNATQDPRSLTATGMGAVAGVPGAAPSITPQTDVQRGGGNVPAVAPPSTNPAAPSPAATGAEIAPGVYRHGRGQYSDNASGMGFTSVPGSGGQGTPVGKTVEQAQREGLVGERVGYNPAYDQRLNGATGISAQNMAAADALAGRSQQESMNRVTARGMGALAGGPGSGPVEPGSFTGGFSGVIGTDPRIAQQERERSALVSALSSPLRGAQNGQLTASQRQGMAGLLDAERRDASGNRQADQTAATQRDIAAMREAGENGRAFRRDAIDQQRVGVDAQRYGVEAQAKGLDIRAAQRRESVYDNYSKAKTDEDRQAIAKQFPDLFGQGKDAAHRMEVVRGKTDPMTGQSSGDYVVVQDPKTGEVRQIQMGAASAPQAMPKPASKAEFDALPKGTRFTDPNGQVRIK